MPAPESATTVRRSAWRAVVGAAWVTGAVVCAVLSRESLLASHPAYPVTLAAVAVVGLLLIGTGRQLVPRDRPRHRAATVVGRVAAAVVTVVVLGAIGYLVPLAAAPEAVAAMSGDSAVRVETSRPGSSSLPPPPRRPAWCSCPAPRSTRAPTSLS